MTKLGKNILTNFDRGKNLGKINNKGGGTNFGRDKLWRGQTLAGTNLNFGRAKQGQVLVLEVPYKVRGARPITTSNLGSIGPKHNPVGTAEVCPPLINIFFCQNLSLIKKYYYLSLSPCRSYSPIP